VFVEGPEPPVMADDDVLDDLHADDLARLRQRARQGEIGVAWHRIAAWMVVREHDRGCVGQQRRFERVARVHDRFIECPSAECVLCQELMQRGQTEDREDLDRFRFENRAQQLDDVGRTRETLVAVNARKIGRKIGSATIRNLQFAHMHGMSSFRDCVAGFRDARDRVVDRVTPADDRLAGSGPQRAPVSKN